MNDIKPISVLIFGAGAIGTYVGGSLALAGKLDKRDLVLVDQRGTGSSNEAGHPKRRTGRG